MEFDDKRLERFDWFTRGLLALCGVALVVVTFVTPMRYDLRGALLSGCGILAMAAIGCVYTWWRPEKQLAKSAVAAADLMSFALILGPLSYVVNYAAMPLATGKIIAMDQMLGFDWLHYNNNLDANPILGWGLYLAYMSFVPQMSVILALLLVFKHYGMARILANCFALCALATIIVAGLFPIADAELVYRTQYIPKLGEARDFVDVARSHFFALRSGELTLVPLPKVEGILTFPSYHTMCGVLYAACGSVFVWLRWPLIVWNGMMIAATPYTGAHYVIDTLTGIVLAIAVLGFALGYTQRQDAFARLRLWRGALARGRGSKPGQGAEAVA